MSRLRACTYILCNLNANRIDVFCIVKEGAHPQAKLAQPVVRPDPRMAYPAVYAVVGHKPLESWSTLSIFV